MDPELSAFLNEGFSEQPELDSQPDAFEKFLASAELAGAIGRNGHQHVARFQEATQELDRRFAALEPPIERADYREARKAADSDDEQIPDPVSDVLTKMAGDRRRIGLRAWLADELALGKSAAELIAHAQRHDLETANLLREVAAELGQAA